ncbi:MAG: apolipoprotein N-acyltransferase [Candidatus Methylacidiphilales bacterium]
MSGRNSLRITAAGSAGLMIALSFPPVEWNALAWLSLIPVVCLHVLGTTPRTLRLWIEGLWFGACLFFPGLFWVTEVSVAGWVALSLLMSCYPAVWYVWSARCLKGSGESLHSARNLGRALVLAFGWVGLEWLRGWMLTGFPWLLLGASQWKMAGLIQVAEWGGVGLVSFLVAFISVVLALTGMRLMLELKRSQPIRPHFEFTLGMLLLGLCLLHGIHVLFRRDEPVREITVVAVQPDIPQDPWGPGMALDEAVAKMEVLTRSALAASGQVDLVVWPETPVGQELYNSPEFITAAAWITRERGSALMVGSIVHSGKDVYNAGLLYPAGGGSPQVYYKRHLVMMGEVVPLPDWLPYLDRLVPLGQNFSRGTSAPLLRLFREDGSVLSMGVLICFEDIFSHLSRSYRTQDDLLLVNITNDGWFGRSSQSRQHLAHAVFRAVETRAPLLRVSNNGITALIDHKGVIREGDLLGDWKKESRHAMGTLSLQVKIPELSPTLYEQIGNWPGWLGTLVLFWPLFMGRDRSRSENE